MTSDYIKQICDGARRSSRIIARYPTVKKNNIILAIAAKMRERHDFIISENAKDLKSADESGLSDAMKDRLLLNRDRIDQIAKSVEEISELEDPIGRIECMKIRPSGIRVGQMRVPIGVIAVIYESRPNVTTDIAALCLKSGNSAILRGGKEAINSNRALHKIINESLLESGAPGEAVSFIDRTDRDLVAELLKMNSHIDIVIPRGGEDLINMVTRESTIPVIKHDKGICMTFIDESADFDDAAGISINAKVQRPGVCNAMETLLIHSGFDKKEALLNAIADQKVEIRGCPRTAAILPGRVKDANDDDWDTEFLNMILAVKLVDSIDEAMEHIARHGSAHSDAIVTRNYVNAERFLREVDSAAVFVNSSTRFHDGGEFGLGAEVGISTQKLHARGAMGLEGLTCLKYVIYGNGETR
ncbi:MAG: glutamate-5-semialdehyde dehydrogenase [Spirochaetes bacterium]|jgi:glutamate-5-semialdehyde dehydrogenase|nr:glutamate-5-semialdehyde dehydrogenase [Spirochaetota bacterium]